jgi:hypothetical protein
MVPKYKMDMATIEEWDENNLANKAAVAGVRDQPFHTSLHSSSHSARTPKRCYYTLDVPDLSSPLDEARSRRYSIHMVVVKVSVSERA